MIKHSVKDEVISISIDNKDFSYRVPLKKIGNVTSWKIGEQETHQIVIRNVSKWTLQLFTKKVTEEKYVKKFKTIVQEYSPNNSIDWKATFLAVTIQNEYNWLVKSNAASNKMSEAEIVLLLEEKYKLD